MCLVTNLIIDDNWQSLVGFSQKTNAIIDFD